MGVPRITMAFVPYARGYGYPYYGYGHDHFGYHPYGAYGPTLEEGKKIREAVEDAVAKEKEFYEKERELVKKLGGYPYAFGGAYGYGYPGYGAYPYGAARGYGYGYPYRY